MGTYIGSPWGQIRGKVFDHVGGVWKGLNWLRVRVLPTQRGTLDLYRKLKDGLIVPELFSFPQMNIRRAVLQVLGYIARMNMSLWIYPVWEALCTKRGWIMTGTNAFIKRNAAILLNTMDRDIEFDETTNAPDITKMIVSDGDLEAPAGITSATYNTGTGATMIIWDTSIFSNGSPMDIANIIVARKPLLESIGRDGTWAPKLYLYPFIPIAPEVIRGEASATVSLPSGLTATDLVAYLFFRDPEGIIGYSKSVGHSVTT